MTGSCRKPSSVRPRADGWSSIWDGRRRPPRATYPRLPRKTWTVWVTPRRLLGLAPTGGYRAIAVASNAVGSYPTVSPLPLLGRSILCGPYRRLTAPRCYLAVYPVELGLSSTHRPREKTAAATIAHDPSIVTLNLAAPRPSSYLRSHQTLCCPVPGPQEEGSSRLPPRPSRRSSRIPARVLRATAPG